MGKKSHKKEHKKNQTKRKNIDHLHLHLRQRLMISGLKISRVLRIYQPNKQLFSQKKSLIVGWISCAISLQKLKKKKNSKNKDLEDAKARMDKPGQSKQELNPYWKNGGSGLPPSKSLSHHKGFLKPNIDDDNNHDSYNRHQQPNYTRTSHSQQSWKKYDRRDNKNHSKYDSEKHDNEEKYKRHREYDEKKSERDKRYRKYEDEIKGENNKRNKDYEHKRVSQSIHYRESEKNHKTVDVKYEEEETEYNNKHLETDKNTQEQFKKPIPASELNALAAKQIKAELMGNTKLAKELQQKLDSARNNITHQNNIQNKTKQKEFVLLTRTSSKGYSYPVKQAQTVKHGDNKKREKVLTHEDGKRVRYFDDDDKYSLKSMFEKEMTSTAEDSNMEFVKLSRKVNSRDDEDDVFVERASEKRSAKASEREIKRAIDEHKRTNKILNSCRYCFESEEMLKHLFIAKGEKCYICLPSYKSLTEGHCLIVPIYHYACATDIDEDVWTEMQVFRKVLTSMFKHQDEDVIFFESAMHLHNMPHMAWNCVPVPIEIGDTAPIYFKKAILECETEWAINKKVVELSNKDIRRAIPKSLPYFAVDFGMQGGYAHVIEDEKIFPNNFAEEIIGGMMDLDHNAWRKKQKEPIEEQLLKTTKFLEIWKEYDFTTK